LNTLFLIEHGVRIWDPEIVRISTGTEFYSSSDFSDFGLFEAAKLVHTELVLGHDGAVP
jgi:hypothetical protein